MKTVKKPVRDAETNTLSSKGAAKRNEILAAARSVMVEEGNVALTARRVARELNVSLSHVQYYFPDRDEMIKAILEAHLLEAQEKVVRSSRADNPWTAILKVVLKDQRSRESCRIFWELWAVTGREDKVSHLLNDFHHEYVVALTPYVRQMNETLPIEQARVRAILIAAMLEGLSLFRGYGRKPPVPFAQLDPAIMQAINAVAQMQVAPAQTSSDPG